MGAAAKQMKERDDKSTPAKVRLNFDFSQESLEKLDEIANAIGAPTRAEVIRRALKLFSKVVEFEKTGATLVVEKPGERPRELTFL